MPDQTELSLNDQYWNWVLDKKAVSPSKTILFHILDDFTDRRGLRHEWEGIDQDIKDEILEVWYKIIKEGTKDAESTSCEKSKEG